MLNSAVLDVALGLVYVFVLVSILVSAVNELVAGLLKQRASSLWRGIAELVRSPDLRDDFYGHPLIKSLAPPTSGPALQKRMTGPSYIPKETFSLTLLDILQQPHAKLRDVERALLDLASSLRAGGQPAAASGTALEALGHALPDSAAGQAVRADLTTLTGLITAHAAPAQILALADAIRASLPARLASTLELAAGRYSEELATIFRALAADAAGGIESFRRAIEGWFEAGMERVSGWYKRWTQLWQMVIGLALAIALNVNVVTIGNDLWQNIPLRTAIVAEAEKFAAAPPPGLWVVDAGTPEGELGLAVAAPGLGPDRNRVVITAVLPDPVAEDTVVSLKVSDDAITADKLIIPKGRRRGDAAGTFKGTLPATVTLEASYTAVDKGQQVAKSAKRTVQIAADPGTRIERTRGLLEQTRLPIGWPRGFDFQVSMLPGWILTAVGASFGAPFWFDLLNRIVRLRAGGAKPKTP